MLLVGSVDSKSWLHCENVFQGQLFKLNGLWVLMPISNQIMLENLQSASNSKKLNGLWILRLICVKKMLANIQGATKIREIFVLVGLIIQISRLDEQTLTKSFRRWIFSLLICLTLKIGASLNYPIKASSSVSHKRICHSIQICSSILKFRSAKA